jgi:DNA polymerase-4
MDRVRQIIHIDMDAFYAAIEHRDNPVFRGMPICVGGNPKVGRGVVMTCSYEARKYGIHSAMPVKTAYKLCPHAIFVKPRFDVYVSDSERIRNILYQFTDHVQPMSLDEAYLDITDISDTFISAEKITKKILTTIKAEVGITASAGVSFNKFLAKIGSDHNKPNGITVITIDNADEFIDKLPIGKFYGIGKKTEQRMLVLGIKTGRDLKNFGLNRLKKYFGKAGEYYYNCAIGVDDREVGSDWKRKSLGHERTLWQDIDDISEMLTILEKLAVKIEEYIKEKNLLGKTITLRMRYSNYKRITRSITLLEPVDDAKIIMDNIKKLLNKTEAGSRKVRLLGIAISNFIRDENHFKFKQSNLEIK